jgi:hypothetical protein
MFHFHFKGFSFEITVPPGSEKEEKKPKGHKYDQIKDFISTNKFSCLSGKKDENTQC